MDDLKGLPARRKLDAPLMEERLKNSLKNLASSLFTAQGPAAVWAAMPQSLQNAGRKKQDMPDEPGQNEAITMAAQFGKVSTTNPMVHEFLDKRIVRLTGPIDEASASATIAMMQLLDDLAPGQDIELRINSPGGSVTAGLAIYDAMKNLNCDVKTVCEGEAMSMAAVLLIAGTPGKRFAMPNSTIMVHNVSGGFKGTTSDMKIYTKEMERMEKMLAEVVMQHSGLSEKAVQDLFNRDHFMSPSDAKGLNLIDDVVQARHKPPFPLPRPAMPMIVPKPAA